MESVRHSFLVHFAFPNLIAYLYYYLHQDRSNGFEKKLFTREAGKEARQEEAYQYSVSDM